MQTEGPPLEALTHRLAETPEDFLLDPARKEGPRVQVEAVVGDLIERLGGLPPERELVSLLGSADKARPNREAIALLLCWLLADDWALAARPTAGDLLELLGATATELAKQAPAQKYLQDADRREELSRLALARLGLRPAGETLAQAQDRLTSISSTERARVVRASRAAEQRAQEVREALARKAAEESADKYTRE
jgi:hypothetical protein